MIRKTIFFIAYKMFGKALIVMRYLQHAVADHLELRRFDWLLVERLPPLARPQLELPDFPDHPAVLVTLLGGPTLPILGNLEMERIDTKF